MFTPLVILTLISASGLLLFFFRNINRTFLNLLIGLGAGSMLSVSLVHIFPEALEQTEFAVYAFIAGFLVVYIIEEILTPHKRDHGHGDHSHEDPHEHYDHVALVSWIAIFLHTLFDGLGIRAGFGISKEIGYAVLAGVAIHQIPVSLSLAAIFRESRFRKNTQILFLIFFAFAASIGFLLSDLVLSDVSPVFTGLATAFAGGSLLYVATADLLPVIHAQTRNKYATVLLFIIGCVGMSLVKIFEN
ncbi:ZIP family metal transporter [Candidatus Gracilibacteria bacterium]|nr:ZIP family metal transporter [Candidatus Gracilibacteria bacterium]